MKRLSIFAALALACGSLVSTASATPHFAQPPGQAPAAEARLESMPPLPPTPATRENVRQALAVMRDLNLQNFRAYQKQGAFPSNTFQPNKLNVWRDRDGHLCAAATIIDRSGEHALVAKVASETNFIRLGDVKQGPLMDWMLTSGFTQEEIARIQEPFMPVSDRQRPQIIEAQRRATEDARLRAVYASVEKGLVQNADHSLDLATDRLMKNPALAAQLVGDEPVNGMKS